MLWGCSNSCKKILKASGFDEYAFVEEENDAQIEEGRTIVKQRHYQIEKLSTFNQRNFQKDQSQINDSDDIFGEAGLLHAPDKGGESYNLNSSNSEAEMAAVV